MGGDWLNKISYLEQLIPGTGVTTEVCSFEEKRAVLSCGTSNVVIARRVGSTYSYGFLGLMEVNLLGEWNVYTSVLPEGSVSVPRGYVPRSTLCIVIVPQC